MKKKKEKETKEYKTKMAHILMMIIAFLQILQLLLDAIHSRLFFAQSLKNAIRNILIMISKILDHYYGIFEDDDMSKEFTDLQAIPEMIKKIIETKDLEMFGGLLQDYLNGEIALLPKNKGKSFSYMEKI